jgi:hypothetical protein
LDPSKNSCVMGLLKEARRSFLNHTLAPAHALWNHCR